MKLVVQGWGRRVVRRRKRREKVGRGLGAKGRLVVERLTMMD